MLANLEPNTSSTHSLSPALILMNFQKKTKDTDLRHSQGKHGKRMREKNIFDIAWEKARRGERL